MGIGTSIVLIAIGAVLAFAVNLESTVGGTTVDWNVVGYILMAAGALGLVLTFTWLGSRRRDGCWHRAWCRCALCGCAGC